jgi:hypothetical protein
LWSDDRHALHDVIVGVDVIVRVDVGVVGDSDGDEEL